MRPVVVTGATGTVGTNVVQQLLAAGAEVRAAVRSPEKVPPTPGLEAVAIDFSQPETLTVALAGAEHLFLLTAFTPEMIAQSNALVDAARIAGIEHVVKLSAMGAGPNAAIRLGKIHTEGERYLEDSGLGWTHLRPNSFMQNYLTYYGETIRTQNAFYLPHGDGKMSLVDVRDVAAVAVMALTEPGHMGKAYELTGTTALGNTEIAAILTGVLGREISYVDVPDEAARQAMADMGSPQVMIDTLMGLNNIIRDGYTAGVTNTVEVVTGRPAMIFETFATDHAEVWA
jgi:uncharacterized protein YbjT (DUF2867 family)